jgi:hypothetical protein
VPGTGTPTSTSERRGGSDKQTTKSLKEKVHGMPVVYTQRRPLLMRESLVSIGDSWNITILYLSCSVCVCIYIYSIHLNNIYIYTVYIYTCIPLWLAATLSLYCSGRPPCWLLLGFSGPALWKQGAEMPRSGCRSRCLAPSHFVVCWCPMFN